MRIGNQAEYLLFRAAVGGLAMMPDRWSAAVCRKAGWLAGPILGVRKHIVQQQLSEVYPNYSADEIQQLTGLVYDHLGTAVAETFCSDPVRLAAQVSIAPDWHILDEAMAAGRGVLVVTAHLGNFELGGRILAARYPVLDVVKPMRNSLFGRYLEQVREKHGIETVPMAASGRAVLTHLRKGGLVTLLIDQDAGAEGVRTDFLGRPASTWPGAARLALRTGCPVVPIGIIRQADNRHVLRIGEPVATDSLLADDKNIAKLTARISGAVESFIMEQPAQWFWVHRRWKGAAEARSIP